MAKYRKKPVEVEAVRFIEALALVGEYESWGVKRIGVLVRRWGLPALEGKMVVVHGDWLIRGVKGEVYPCKDDIFQLTYDLVEDKTSSPGTVGNRRC